MVYDTLLLDVNGGSFPQQNPTSKPNSKAASESPSPLQYWAIEVNGWDMELILCWYPRENQEPGTK